MGIRQSNLLTDQLLEGLPDCISKVFGVVENPAERHNHEPGKTHRNLHRNRNLHVSGAARRRANLEETAIPRALHANIDVEWVIENLADHVHVALSVLLHAGIGIAGKMIVIALQRACKQP